MGCLRPWLCALIEEKQYGNFLGSCGSILCNPVPVPSLWTCCSAYCLLSIPNKSENINHHSTYLQERKISELLGLKVICPKPTSAHSAFHENCVFHSVPRFTLHSATSLIIEGWIWWVKLHHYYWHCCMSNEHFLLKLIQCYTLKETIHLKICIFLIR